MNAPNRLQDTTAPPPPGSYPPPPAAYPPPAYAQTKKRNWRRILLIAALVPIGIFLALVLLGMVLVAFGFESSRDSRAIDGAEIVDEYVGTNGGTTWTVVTDNEDPSDAELEQIATALISLPDAEPLLDEGLDILLFDEGGRRLRGFTDTTQELDQAGPSGDIEKILELAQNFPTEWVDEHSLGVVMARLGDDGAATYTLCDQPVGSTPGCGSDELTVLQPST